MSSWSISNKLQLNPTKRSGRITIGTTKKYQPSVNVQAKAPLAQPSGLLMNAPPPTVAPKAPAPAAPDHGEIPMNQMGQENPALNAQVQINLQFQQAPQLPPAPKPPQAQEEMVMGGMNVPPPNDPMNFAGIGQPGQDFGVPPPCDNGNMVTFMVPPSLPPPPPQGCDGTNGDHAGMNETPLQNAQDQELLMMEPPKDNPPMNMMDPQMGMMGMAEPPKENQKLEMVNYAQDQQQQQGDMGMMDQQMNMMNQQMAMMQQQQQQQQGDMGMMGMAEPPKENQKLEMVNYAQDQQQQQQQMGGNTGMTGMAEPPKENQKLEMVNYQQGQQQQQQQQQQGDMGMMGMAEPPKDNQQMGMNPQMQQSQMGMMNPQLQQSQMGMNPQMQARAKLEAKRKKRRMMMQQLNINPIQMVLMMMVTGGNNTNYNDDFSDDVPPPSTPPQNPQMMQMMQMNQLKSQMSGKIGGMGMNMQNQMTPQQKMAMMQQQQQQQQMMMMMMQQKQQNPGLVKQQQQQQQQMMMQNMQRPQAPPMGQDPMRGKVPDRGFPPVTSGKVREVKQVPGTEAMLFYCINGVSNSIKINRARPVVTMGRHTEVDVRLDPRDASISRFHATIMTVISDDETTAKFIFKDTSQCGSFINNEKTSECELKDGSKIRLGNSAEFIYFGQAYKQKSKSSTQWQSKWLCLTENNVLMYFKEKDDQYPQGLINLQGKRVFNASKPKNAWAISSEMGYLYYFYTKTEKEKDDWITALVHSVTLNK